MPRKRGAGVKRTDGHDDAPVPSHNEGPAREAASGGGSTMRDQLANERTLLAWTRTGIAVIALGFVVARFGLLIRELGREAPRPTPTGISTAIGTALVLLGALLSALALVRYLRTGEAIERGEYHWSPRLGIALVCVLVAAGILLAVYLLITG